MKIISKIFNWLQILKTHWEVSINAPESDVSCGLITLPNNFLAADALLKKACHHLTEDELSSRFVVQSTVGVPNAPEDLQNSSFYFQ